MPAADRWPTPRRLFAALLAITLLALVLRLVDLGGRIAHFDEARVAYWTLRYHYLGAWEYHPVVHGPFLFHINEVVYGLFDASDTTMRLIVALVAGISPLAAWLYREHLSSIEVGAMALLLALNPVLLYYGRFSRNDVLLAVTMVFAFGFLLRAYDTGRSTYLYPGLIAIALGFTMKENALLYLFCWGGATVAVFGHRWAYQYLATRFGRTPDRWNLRETWRHRLPDEPRRWVRDGIISVVAGIAVLMFFFAPRGMDEPGIGDLLTAPWKLPAVLDASILEGARKLYNHWISGGRGPPYLDSMSFYVEVLIAGASVLLILVIVGLVWEHWRSSGPRWLVVFALVWGLLSIGGYPYAGTINAPWLVAHMVAPLTIPAAVGLGKIIDLGIAGYAREDLVEVAGVALILLAAGSLILWPAYGLVFADATGPDNELVQYAQPGGDWGDTIDQLHQLSEQNEGADVLYVGEEFFTDDTDGETYKVAGSGWYDRLPLPWYTEQVQAETISTMMPAATSQAIRNEEPPVVIVPSNQAWEIESYLEGYEVREHELRHGAFDIHIYLDLDRLDNG